MDAVKATDPDRYLSALTADPVLRDQLIALYAFNNEVSRVREIASDPMVGAIRLQWWRDKIAEPLDSTAATDPVSDGLSALLSHSALIPDDLLALIDARERDLDEPVIETWDALDLFCDETAGRVVRLALALAGITNEELAIAAGRCWGITGLARAFPFHAGQGRVYMPAEAFKDVKLDPHDVFQGREPNHAFAILYAAMTRAQDYFNEAKPLIRALPKAARATVSYVALYDLYARQLCSRPGEAYLIHPEIPAFRKQMKLMLGGLV